MQDKQRSGQGDDMEGAIAVFSAVEELADVTAGSVLTTSPHLDRTAVRRQAAQALLRTVARVAESTDDDYLNDEDAVLRDAARDMDEWIERLPAESGWVLAFDEARGHILEAIEEGY